VSASRNGCPNGLQEYASTPSGELRRAVAAGSFAAIYGYPEKVVRAMIDSVDASPAPRRLTLGSTGLERMRTKLQRRFAELEAQRDVAYAADVSDVAVNIV